MSDSEKTIADLKIRLAAREAELRLLRSQFEELEQNVGSTTSVESDLMHEIQFDGAKLASVGAWNHNLETDRIHWTEEVFKIHAIEPGSVPPHEECLAFYSKKDRARVAAAVKKLAEESEPYDMECDFIDAKGAHRFVHIKGQVHSSKDGKPTALSGIIQDITNQYVMKRGMEAFFTLTPDLIGAIDYDSRPVTLSPSWQSLLGWTQHEMIHMGVDCVVHEKDRQPMGVVFKRAIASGKIESLENRVVSKEGEEYWYSWRLFADPSTELVFIAARDLTRQKNTEKALKDAKIQSEAANQAKSDFLAIMSHELRTPLNPILGFADLLLSELEDPEHLEILDAISCAGQCLTTVIGDVLDFAKIESGNVQLSEDTFDLQVILEKSLRLMEGQIKVKPVKLSMNFEKSADIPDDCRFIGDSDKISQVLFNLLDNAIKFTEKGSVVLDSSLVTTGDGRVLCHVEVRDTGIGIAESSQETIFQPFIMGDSSSTRRYGGTGLGLAISKKLVELMGGTISAKSVLNKGTCMSFTLPLKLERLASQIPKLSEGVSEIFIEGKHHVLLVEDNATNIFYIRRLMERMGCEVTSVASGEEAMAEYKPGLYDLLLLDIHMPGMSGVDVLRDIREDEAQYGFTKLPIVMLTADVLPATRQQCMKYGADGFLIKPVRAQELFDAVSLVLESN